MRLSAAVLVIVGLGLAGCGSTTSTDKGVKAAPAPKPVAVKVGTCLAGEATDSDEKVPDFSTIVQCSKPHIYEINALVDLPAETLTGSTDAEELANRSDLAHPADSSTSSPQRTAYLTFAASTCLPAMQKTTGLDAISVNGKSAAEARVNATLRIVNMDWRSITPEELWLKGQRQIVCSSRFTETQVGSNNAAARAIASPGNYPIAPTLLTTTFRPEWRQCGSYDKDNTFTSVDCSVRHYDEVAFTFDAKPVFGADFVEGFDVKTDDYATFDKACAGALTGYLAPDWDRSVLNGRAATGTEGWGTKGADFYPILCEIVPKDAANFDLPPGSLIGATGTGLKLLPFG